MGACGSKTGFLSKNEATREPMGGWLRLGVIGLLLNFVCLNLGLLPVWVPWIYVSRAFAGRSVQGYLAHKKMPNPLGP